jgi:hypothetical protein
MVASLYENYERYPNIQNILLRFQPPSQMLNKLEISNAVPYSIHSYCSVFYSVIVRLLH